MSKAKEGIPLTVEQFINEERDLLIMLLGITGVRFKIALSDHNMPRLKLSSLDLRDREIEEISIYDHEIELVNDRLISIGFEFIGRENDRAIYRMPEEEQEDDI